MDDNCSELRAFMARVPSIKSGIGSGQNAEGLWWIKFQIDNDTPLAWNVVQELGNIVNYLSIEERLPTKFFPVSPPAYLNGGPRDFLSWVIEADDQGFLSKDLCAWLEARMPRPVDDLTQWGQE